MENFYDEFKILNYILVNYRIKKEGYKYNKNTLGVCNDEEVRFKKRKKYEYVNGFL